MCTTVFNKTQKKNKGTPIVELYKTTFYGDTYSTIVYDDL